MCCHPIPPFLRFVMLDMVGFVWVSEKGNPVYNHIEFGNSHGQTGRFNGVLNVQLQMSDSVWNVSIPPLLLAFPKMALSDKLLLWIRIAVNEGHLCVFLCDGDPQTLHTPGVYYIMWNVVIRAWAGSAERLSNLLFPPSFHNQAWLVMSTHTYIIQKTLWCCWQ